MDVTDSNPWARAVARAAEQGDQPVVEISEGATVIDVDRHPIYGTRYRCQTWMAHMPWTLDRKSTVHVYRGDVFDQPEHIGEAKLARLRRNGADVQTVPVGFNADEPKIEVFLAGADAPAVLIGDTFIFGPD